MGLPTVLLMVGGLWICVLCLFVSLCRAAKLGDEALVRAMVAESSTRRRRRSRPERSHLRAAGARAVGFSSARR